MTLLRSARLPARIEFEPLLKAADLLGVPAFGRADQALGNVARGVVIELGDRPAQPDVDVHHHLLDRAEAVGVVGATVARSVEQLVGGQEPPGAAVDHLLVGRRRRPRPAAGVVDEELDRRAVDDIEADDVAAAGAPDLEGRRVDRQEVVECRAQPRCEFGLAVGMAPELGQRVDTPLRVRPRAVGVARDDRPIELLDLVLAGLDRSRHEVILRKCPQVVEARVLPGPRRIDKIVADREVPGAHPLRVGRDQRFARRKEAGAVKGWVHAGKRLLAAPERARRAPGIRERRSAGTGDRRTRRHSILLPAFAATSLLATAVHWSPERPPPCRARGKLSRAAVRGVQSLPPRPSPGQA